MTRVLGAESVNRYRTFQLKSGIAWAQKEPAKITTCVQVKDQGSERAWFRVSH
jgi:hypothetical protein